MRVSTRWGGVEVGGVWGVGGHLTQLPWLFLLRELLHVCFDAVRRREARAVAGERRHEPAWHGRRDCQCMIWHGMAWRALMHAGGACGCMQTYQKTHKKEVLPVIELAYMGTLHAHTYDPYAALAQAHTHAQSRSFIYTTPRTEPTYLPTCASVSSRWWS